MTDPAAARKVSGASAPDGEQGQFVADKGAGSAVSAPRSRFAADPVAANTATRAVTICAKCGLATWLSEHCGEPAVEATVHLVRESATRKGSFHLICRTSMRGDDFRVGDGDQEAVNCAGCLAILARETRAAA